jgi:hypothetical protein
MHYLRFRRYGNFDEPDHRLKPVVHVDSKVCPSCNQDLPIAAFPRNSDIRDVLRKHSICRKCRAKKYKKHVESQKTKGLCVHCNEPAKPGFVKCEAHLKMRLNWRATPISRAKELLAGAKKRAADNGTICSIDLEWVMEKLAGRCELTGLPFDLQPGKRQGHFNPYTPTIDKKLPGDYSPENSRLVIAAINMGMNSWGEEVYRIVARAYLHHRRSRKSASRITGPSSYEMFTNEKLQ